VNAAGIDRLGIVSDVTGLVISHNGNVGESVAGRLSSSYFSLMMLITVPEQNRIALQTAIQSVPDLHAAVFIVDEGSSKNTNSSIESSSSTPTIGCTYSYSLLLLFLLFEWMLLITTYVLMYVSHTCSCNRYSLYFVYSLFPWLY
jgi:predicted amino acid-binding ACT domain protein